VRAVRTNHSLFSEQLAAVTIGEVKRDRQLDTSRRGLPPATEDAEAANKKVEYDPCSVRFKTLSTEMDSEVAGSPVSRERRFPSFKQLTQTIDQLPVYGNNLVPPSIPVISNWKQDLAVGAVPIAVFNEEAANI
jgi:hypothetical protein